MTQQEKFRRYLLPSSLYYGHLEVKLYRLIVRLTCFFVNHDIFDRHYCTAFTTFPTFLLKRDIIWQVFFQHNDINSFLGNPNVVS